MRRYQRSQRDGCRFLVPVSLWLGRCGRTTRRLWLRDDGLSDCCAGVASSSACFIAVWSSVCQDERCDGFWVVLSSSSSVVRHIIFGLYSLTTVCRVVTTWPLFGFHNASAFVLFDLCKWLRQPRLPSGSWCDGSLNGMISDSPLRFLRLRLRSDQSLAKRVASDSTPINHLHRTQAVLS